MRNDRRAAHGDGDARAGHARLQGAGLGRPHEHGVPQPEVVGRADAGQAVGPPQDQAEDDQHHAHEPFGAQALLDQVVQGGTDHGGGDGRSQQQPGQALVHPLDGPPPQRAHGGTGEHHQVAPEVGGGTHEGAHVEGDVEGAVEVGVAGELPPPEEPRHQDQVAAGGDGQELRQALDDAQDDGVDEGHAGVRRRSCSRRRWPA
jgi:hypothetical protein